MAIGSRKKSDEKSSSIPLILQRQQQQLAKFERQKGSFPLLTQATLQMYNPAVEQSVDSYFLSNERKQVDLRKMKELINDLRTLQIQQLKSAKPFVARKLSADPFIKNSVIRAKL